MNSIPNPKIMRINTKSPILILRLSNTKSGVGLLKIGFLACLTRMGGPS